MGIFVGRVFVRVRMIFYEVDVREVVVCWGILGLVRWR